MHRPVLYFSDIFRWIDEFQKRMKRWPRRDDGLIQGSLGVTWTAVDLALKKGLRGLPGGSSLPQLLAEHRGVRNRMRLPHYTLSKILRWADGHRKRTGRWPTTHSGPVLGAPGETWLAVGSALRQGTRGMGGGTTLARLLQQHRSTRNHMALPPLTGSQILAWADAYHQRTGRWPTRTSGPIPEAPGEKWLGVSTALSEGYRGWPGGLSLAKFLAKHRGVRNRKGLPPLLVQRIVSWARAYVRRHGRRPRHISGPIPEAPGETWSAVHDALRNGGRGFPGGSSLYQLLRAHWKLGRSSRNSGVYTKDSAARRNGR
jgi:hypothetical protein